MNTYRKDNSALKISLRIQRGHTTDYQLLWTSNMNVALLSKHCQLTCGNCLTIEEDGTPNSTMNICTFLKPLATSLYCSQGQSYIF